MADPIYDDESAKKKPEGQEPGGLSSEELQESEEESNAHDGEANGQSIEDSDDDETKRLQDRVDSEWASAREEDKKARESLYKKTGDQDKSDSVWSKIRKRRKWVVIGAAASGALITLVVILLNFLGIYKLDFLVSSIDQRVFARFTSVADRRSGKWIQAYLTMRLTQWGDGNGPGQIENNQIFRSNKVDTNHPIRDWYRTMRTSSFERDLLNDWGIKFVSVADSNGKVKPGYIDLNGEKIVTIDMPQGDFDAIGDGNVEVLNKYTKFLDVNEFANDKEARRAIKRVVHDRTRFYQLIERRNHRKAIQNMTGVRSWRFFEDTRNKVDETKINIRNKIITAAIPESTLTGKFLRCMLGMAVCQKSADSANPDARATVTDIGVNKCDSKCEDDTKTTKDVPDYDSSSPVDNPQRKKVEVERCPPGKTCPPTKLIKVTEIAPDYDLTPRQAEILDFSRLAIKGVFKAIPVINVIELLELIEGINSALSGGLTKMVSVARGVQAMGLYQSTKTASHQIKNGNVNSAELNEYLKVYGNVARSEAFTKVISKDDPIISSVAPSAYAAPGDPGSITNSTESNKYCSRENQNFIVNPANRKEAREQFHYLCDNKQIGGGSNAAKIEEAYQRSFGPILGPISTAWKGLKNNTVLGGIIAFTYKVMEGVLGATGKALIDIIKFVGLGDSLKKVENAMFSLVGKLASFLGAGPILSENDPEGVLFNWMVQGGAYTAEHVSRHNGAAATKPETKRSALINLAGYRAVQLEQQSLYDRYISTSNPDSVASRGLFAASEIDKSTLMAKWLDLRNILEQIATVFTRPFIQPTMAVEFSGYEGADFAGIQTYDFPAQCVNLDPLDSGPITETNIFQVLNNSGIAASPTEWGPTTKEQWEIANNSEKFYDYLYAKVKDRENPDPITMQVYNCNLLDTAVRGGLGYLYGYKNDNGLDEPSIEEGSGELDCGAESTIDQNPGVLGNAAQYVPYIEQYAPGRFCTDEQIAAAGGTFRTPSNATPNDGLRMYFANCADGCPRYQKNSEAELTGGGTWIGPGEYIRVKYRNPPGGGNSIWIPVFGGSGSNNPGGSDPPGGTPAPPPGPPGAE